MDVHQLDAAEGIKNKFADARTWHNRALREQQVIKGPQARQGTWEV